ncbi:putative helicase mov-10-B.1 [Diachasma alloeum]|uniref:putative helicase mov-10-B.1 n=1 Tax=Diachasma alloeum TaxID=454923 RepID=UPI0007382CDE|nr:putative helicase mov-10-B.1 [Diachasma alloeum]
MDFTDMIAALSRRDTVQSAPRVQHDSSLIPQELYDVLESGVTPSEKFSQTSQQYLKVLKGLSSFKDIDQDIYWYLWKLLLYLEQYQGIVECRKYSLSGKRLQRASIRKGEYVIYVPGLEEDRPSIRARDWVDITSVNGTAQTAAEIKFVGANYISVLVDNRFALKYSTEQLYDIAFRWSDWESNNLNFALDKVKKFNLMRMVFPIGGKYNNAKHEKLTWVNKNIEENPEQQQAILNILAKTSQPDPYILFGPPGTGKTSTLIEAILQIHKRNSSTRILICTPSNSAADEIALKLLRHSPDLIGESALYRLYSASRNIDDVHESIKSASNLASDEAIFLPKDVFVTKKIVIVTLATAIRVYNYSLKEDHFGYLFIDEAGQATEPQTLIPLLTMCGYHVEMNGKPRGQVVIAGDPQQLGPSCQSRLSAPILSVSMLERLMSWGPYQRSEATGYDPNYVTKLVRNYRCHPAILHVPNKLFYDGELVPCGGAHTKRASNWFYLPRKKFPVMFHAVKGDEHRERYSPSVYNPYEVRVIVDYVKKLIGSNLGGRLIKEEEVGIVTPYRLQKAKIVEALEKTGLTNIAVGTVEIFQGQERDVIIISTVRSVLYRWAGGKIHIGFLSNPKRFNVAVTRAKALLIVIGNPLILQHDECWREFMQYCLDNNAWCGPKHLLEKYVSHREIAKLLGRRHEARPRWDPNANLPVVEDPTSAKNYKAVDEERGVRRRRLPVGWTETGSDCSGDTLRNMEDFEYWPEEYSDQSRGDSGDEESEEGGDDEEIMEFCDSSDSKTGSLREEQKEKEEDGLFKKLRRRMEELEISSSSSTNSAN